MFFALFILLIVCLISTCSRYFSLLHPTFVFSALWACQIFALILLDDMFINISQKTINLVIFGNLAFLTGGMLSERLYSRKIISNRTFSINSFTLIVLLGLSIWAVIMQVQIVLNQPGYSLAEKLIYTRYRESILHEDVFGLIKYASSLILSLFLFLLMKVCSPEARHAHSIAFLLILVLVITNAFFSTGRTPLIIIMFVIFVSISMRPDGTVRKVRIVYTFAIGVLLLLLIYWMVGTVFGKVGDTLDHAVIGLTTYLFSGLPALDVYLHSDAHKFNPITLGENSFRFILAVLSKLGIVQSPRPLVQDFVNVPHPTNLYTMYHLVIADFGYVFSCIYPGLLGFIHIAIYSLFRFNYQNDFLRYIFLLSLVPLIQVIFQDTYFSLVSSWLQLLFFGFIFTRADR